MSGFSLASITDVVMVNSGGQFDRIGHLLGDRALAGTVRRFCPGFTDVSGTSVGCFPGGIKRSE